MAMLVAKLYDLMSMCHGCICQNILWKNWRYM